MYSTTCVCVYLSDAYLCFLEKYGGYFQKSSAARIGQVWFAFIRRSTTARPTATGSQQQRKAKQCRSCLQDVDESSHQMSSPSLSQGTRFLLSVLSDYAIFSLPSLEFCTVFHVRRRQSAISTTSLHRTGGLVCPHWQLAAQTAPYHRKRSKQEGLTTRRSNFKDRVSSKKRFRRF